MRYFPIAIVLISTAMLGGCSEGVLDPQGPVAAAERQIMFNSTGIMLAIVIPTMLATLGIAYWFRASNKRARYLPEFAYSGRLEVLVWSIPIMTVILVGGVAWVGSSGVMNSFFVPQLGGQIYTMAGMVTRLNLRADHAGTYRGISSNYSGAGFSDMHFNVDAIPEEKFAQWLSATRTAGPTLDSQSYSELAKPSQAITPFTYRAVASGLFNTILSAGSPHGSMSVAHLTHHH